MLEPAAASSPMPQTRAVIPEDESLTEDYGEPSSNARSDTGGVDFFSSLGTERHKKPKVDLAEVCQFP